MPQHPIKGMLCEITAKDNENINIWILTESLFLDANISFNWNLIIVTKD